MRTTLFVLVGLAMILILSGASYLVPGDYRFTGTWQDQWTPCGSGDSPGVFLEAQTTPNTAQRSKATFEATYQTFQIPPYWNYIEFRCSADSSDNASIIHDIFVSDGVGDYLLGVTLTFTSGEQVQSAMTGYYFCDTVAATEKLLTGTALSPTGNYAATYRVDRRWVNKIGIVNTVQDANDLLEIVGY